MHSRGFLVRIFTSVIRVRSSPSVKDQTSWQFMQIAKKAYRGEACARSAAKARRTGWKKAEVQGGRYPAAYAAKISADCITLAEWEARK